MMMTRSTLFEEETDLRSICRWDEYETTVIIPRSYPKKEQVWLRLGEATLRPPESHGNRRWTLEAYLGGGPNKLSPPTDFEHDNALACRFTVVGVELESVRYGVTTVSAWVDPEAYEFGVGEFRVPGPEYNPCAHPDATFCENDGCLKLPKKDGGGTHVIVPEGFYIPPHTAELYAVVRGLQIEIVFSKKGG